MNGLEKRLGDQANVYRIDLLSQLGKEIAQLYDANKAGTNILLDGNGAEIYRTKGVPKNDKVIELIGKL